MDRENLASGLGWFSIGLGLLEVSAPQKVADWLGMKGREGLIQAYGVREIANGIAILSQPKPAEWVWARVGGDALDLATLASAFTPDNPKKLNVGVAIMNVLSVTALDVLCAKQLGEQKGFDRAREQNRTGVPGEVRAGDHTLTLGQPAEF